MPSAPASIGLIGHGRFGAAFAALLAEHGHAWLALDARAAVPEAHRARDLADLAARSQWLVLAVPVPRIEETLQALRPHLHAGHVVIDVGSVKVHPCEALDRCLGDAIPHAGTHPLFGPLSIARADPLRAIVCPSARHPEAARAARALFESIGADVLDLDAASHDQLMASTHAMAFFIARGLVEMGIGDDLRWAPPSFAALAASIAAVRADAGHLFNAIQRENPFAAAARKQFIEALSTIDGHLDASAADTPVPALDARADRGDDADEHLRRIDRELEALRKRRQELAARAGRAPQA